MVLSDLLKANQAEFNTCRTMVDIGKQLILLGCNEDEEVVKHYSERNIPWLRAYVNIKLKERFK